MTGSGYILEGGLTPMPSIGSADDFQVHQSGDSAFCGNNLKENDEACDGSDLGGETCQSKGFSQGSLRCTSTCTMNTTGCSHSSAAGDTTLHGAVSGGGTGGHRSNPPVENTPVAPETKTAVPAPNFGTPAGGRTMEKPPRMPLTPEPSASSFRAATQKTLSENPEQSVPGEPPNATGENAAVSENDRTPLSGEVVQNDQATENPFPVASAVALGSMSLTQAGILARLAWIARFSSLYGTIPAFLS